MRGGCAGGVRKRHHAAPVVEQGRLRRDRALRGNGGSGSCRRDGVDHARKRRHRTRRRRRRRQLHGIVQGRCARHPRRRPGRRLDERADRAARPAGPARPAGREDALRPRPPGRAREAGERSQAALRRRRKSREPPDRPPQLGARRQPRRALRGRRHAAHRVRLGQHRHGTRLVREARPRDDRHRGARPRTRTVLRWSG